MRPLRRLSLYTRLKTEETCNREHQLHITYYLNMLTPATFRSTPTKLTQSSTTPSKAPRSKDSGMSCCKKAGRKMLTAKKSREAFSEGLTRALFIVGRALHLITLTVDNNSPSCRSFQNEVGPDVAVDSSCIVSRVFLASLLPGTSQYLNVWVQSSPILPEGPVISVLLTLKRHDKKVNK